jgi:predicted dehydrogenase
MAKCITIAIAGGGDRGSEYSQYALMHPDRARVVALAEPQEYNCTLLARQHNIPPANVFTDWRQLAEKPRLADAVIIATQDAMHAEPALALAKKGYAILLEKPMAPNAQDCRRIAGAVAANDNLFAVCHVMRYTDYTRRLKALLEEGLIGEIVSLQHLEPVGWWHQAHSFVRGNWRNEKQSSPMLLAKSCHDLDWIRHIMGVPCRSVQSFGSLYLFRKDRKPAGAGSRCTVDCSIEEGCCYSARKIYLGRLARGHTGWPVSTVAPEPTMEKLQEALRTGPYGRCVWECDNDVVDNQTVNMLFEGGRTAVFTMTAFNNPRGGRRTAIFGTRGEIFGYDDKIRHFDFLTQTEQVIDACPAEQAGRAGHGGGDYRLMEAFVAAVATGQRGHILSGPTESLETHLMVFAAEKSRHENRVVDLAEMT